MSNEILEKLNQLKKIEEEYKKFSTESNLGTKKFLKKSIELGSAAFEVRNAILYEIAISNISSIQTDNESLRRIFVKIKSGGKFYSISAFENISEHLNHYAENDEDKVDASLDNIFWDNYDEINEDFLSWFNVESFYSNRSKVGAIIHKNRLPKNLNKYFNEISLSFSFGLWLASVSMCRALLEMCLFHKCLELEIIKETNNPKEIIWEDRISEKKDIFLDKLLNKAKRVKILNEDKVKLGKEINWEANRILHIKDQEIDLDEGQVLNLIHNTVRVIEKLYK